jgi:hypothetical protein
VPGFLLALLVTRGVPALLYRPVVGQRPTAAAALLQATSLPFIVTATAIGMETGLMTPVTGAALVCAGLASVLLFPAVAVTLMTSDRPRSPDDVRRGASEADPGAAKAPPHRV